MKSKHKLAKFWEEFEPPKPLFGSGPDYRYKEEGVGKGIKRDIYLYTEVHFLRIIFNIIITILGQICSFNFRK